MRLRCSQSPVLAIVAYIFLSMTRNLLVFDILRDLTSVFQSVMLIKKVGQLHLFHICLRECSLLKCTQRAQCLFGLLPPILEACPKQAFPRFFQVEPRFQLTFLLYPKYLFPSVIKPNYLFI